MNHPTTHLIQRETPRTSMLTQAVVPTPIKPNAPHARALARLPDMGSRGLAMWSLCLGARARPRSAPGASSSHIAPCNHSYTISGPYTACLARLIRPIRL